MKYNLKTVNKKFYLHIIFLGSWLRDSGKQILRDIYSIIIGSNYKKILVDFRQSDYLEDSTIMEYDEVETVSTFPGITKYKFATINNSDDVDRFLFWETAAVNRGINIQFFKNEEDAIEWLLK